MNLIKKLFSTESISMLIKPNYQKEIDEIQNNLNNNHINDFKDLNSSIERNFNDNS